MPQDKDLNSRILADFLTSIVARKLSRDYGIIRHHWQVGEHIAEVLADPDVGQYLQDRGGLPELTFLVANRLQAQSR